MTVAASRTIPDALALVNGKAYTEIPAGLYIPPDALAVYLAAFEGPLDLLLYLIRRHHLDVLDIPMAELTLQYMEYVTAMRSQKLELAAEYMLMAVWLIEIKSRMLLPRPVLADEPEEDNDPRADLVRRLLEYEQMRLAARILDDLPRLGRDYAAVHVYNESAEKRLPYLCAEDLQQAWAEMMARAPTHTHHAGARRELSVRAAMEQILRSLQGDLFVEFSVLFMSEPGLSHRVVKFLALLELAREQRLEILQNQAFSPIYMRLSQGSARAD
ncbi:MAG: segregation and condensation protein A [Sulfuriferula sp.]